MAKVSENEQRFLVPTYPFRQPELTNQRFKKKEAHAALFFQPSSPLPPKLHSGAHIFLGLIYAY